MSDDTQSESLRYSWIVRNSDDEPWMLLTYRFTSEDEALQTKDHWHHHYKQVKTVAVFEKWTVIE